MAQKVKAKKTGPSIASKAQSKATMSMSAKPGKKVLTPKVKVMAKAATKSSPAKPAKKTEAKPSGKNTLTAIKSFFTGGVKKAPKPTASAKSAPSKPTKVVVTKSAAAPVSKKAAPLIPTKKGSAKHDSKAAKPESKAVPVKVMAGKPAATAVVGKSGPKGGAKAAAPQVAVSQVTKAAVNRSGALKTSLRPTEKIKAIHEDAVCREVACEGLGTTSGYCRLHYIRNWKKIKRKEVILKEGKLMQFIEELVAKYPEKYLEAIQEDLADVRSFAKVVKDLELDEEATSEDFEGEGAADDDGIDDIKRDIEDETDAF